MTVWQRDGFDIDTAPERLDVDAVHDFLANHSYWAKGIGRDMVARALAGSLAFGLYEGPRQIGLARVVTDRATFAYLVDVYVLEAWRGRGLGRWLVSTVRAHPELQDLRRWMLATRDARDYYRPFGFRDLAHPEWLMEIVDREAYRRGRAKD
jgi:GNAT superfamily N-acetyltransferase